MDGCIDGHVCGCTSINETVLYTISVVGSENVHTLLWCSIEGVLTIAFLPGRSLSVTKTVVFSFVSDKDPRG